MPAGKELGVGNSIWSPLGEGLLTGKINRTQSGEAGTRQGDGWPEPYIKNKALFYQLINVMQEIALNHNVSVAQVTLAWLRDRPNVDSIVLAARTKAQLKDNIASYHLQLANSEIEAISNLTTPEPIYPLWHRAMNAYDKASEAEKIYLSEYNKLMNDKNNLL